MSDRESQTMTVDNLGIIFGRSISLDGLIHRKFRVRGWGPTYQSLCTWLNSIALNNEWNDMPWFGWEFVNELDEETLRKNWGSYFLEDDPDYFQKPERSMTKVFDLEMASVFEEELLKAIREEIDKEIIDIIKDNIP